MTREPMAAKPLITMQNTLVALGPDHADLQPTVQRWLNDFTLRRTQGGVPHAWTAEQIAALHAQTPQAFFIIYRVTDWHPLGFTLWQDLDWRTGTAEYVLGIGDAACRGQGFGTATTSLMLDYAFTTLGLHAVFLTVYEPNVAGIRAYTRAGFRECGRRRQNYLLGGRRWDTIFMECLASDYRCLTTSSTAAKKG